MKIVKPLDDQSYPPLPDHIGWRVWRVAALWKRQFDDAMVTRGFGWFAEARSGVLAHVGPKGVKQSLLGPKMGVTKQAAQQFVDDLVVDGIATRVPDPDDGRGKLVVLTAEGLEVMVIANQVKAEIESRYRVSLGDAAFDQLMQSLGILGDGVPPRR